MASFMEIVELLPDERFVIIPSTDFTEEKRLLGDIVVLWSAVRIHSLPKGSTNVVKENGMQLLLVIAG